MTAKDKTNGKTKKKFRIVLDEEIDQRRIAWFDDVQIKIGDNFTILSGTARDRNELHGLLKRIHDLNLSLKSVNLSETTNTSPQA